MRSFRIFLGTLILMFILVIISILVPSLEILIVFGSIVYIFIIFALYIELGNDIKEYEKLKRDFYKIVSDLEKNGIFVDIENPLNPNMSILLPDRDSKIMLVKVRFVDKNGIVIIKTLDVIVPKSEETLDKKTIIDIIQKNNHIYLLPVDYEIVDFNAKF